MTAVSIDGVVAVAFREPCVLVTIIATSGSTPRGIGARMLVTNVHSEGSIGGGRLEHQEIASARALLAAPPATWLRDVRKTILGPDARQCCGGMVEVLHERISRAEAQDIQALLASNSVAVERPLTSGSPWRASAPPMEGHVVREDDIVRERLVARLRPVVIYGAGHVARALVPLLVPLPVAITWVEIDRNRAPDVIPPEVSLVVTTTPASMQPSPGAIHLVMTHDHDLDYEIVAGLLARRDPEAVVGLIGSATKRARFARRLTDAGLDSAPLICPIGHPALANRGDKAPAAVALAIATDVLTRLPPIR